MFLRFLFIAALIGAAVVLWRRWQRPKPLADKPTLEPALMVRCAQCNTHIPQNSAIAQEGLWYCSQQHQLLGPKSR